MDIDIKRTKLQIQLGSAGARSRSSRAPGPPGTLTATSPATAFPSGLHHCPTLAEQCCFRRPKSRRSKSPR